MPEPLTHEALTAYPRPPQVNGAEQYDVEVKADFIDVTAGRLTRRAAPHNERPTPGWYVWIEQWHYILRGEDQNVCYYPTPEDALKAMWDALCGPAPS